MRWHLLLFALAMMGGGHVQAQPVQTSVAPDAVAVTVYRAPGRDADTQISLDWLGGYALITETRTITIPAGRAIIRFEGVASGILPESAIVTGLPAGVREKNLDGQLLSAASLYDRGFARPVTLRRRRDGKTVEERAVIRSGPAGAAIVETTRGFEVLNCGPTDDAITYDAVPTGLAARPTLSVETDSPQTTTATVSLSYLAWGFDWQANYIATLHPGGRAADLFAWVTLASTDMTSFVDAQTMVVAGRVNRTTGRTANPFERTEPLEFKCYLIDPVSAPPPPAPPPPAMAAPMMLEHDEIVVTAARAPRARMVEQEDLGDLKAYRVPERTTVAARSQKQVAMLGKKAVPINIVYASDISVNDASPPRIVMRAMNRADRGLGLPLPAGPVALFERRAGRELLVGESSTDDKAVGEAVELGFDSASNVTIEHRAIESSSERRLFELTVRNANPVEIRFEGMFDIDTARIERPSRRLASKDGRKLWALGVPANGSVALRYTIVSPR